MPTLSNTSADWQRLAGCAPLRCIRENLHELDSYLELESANPFCDSVQKQELDSERN